MKAKKTIPKQIPAAVFSVSVATGCYRHLRVPTNYKLEDFADAILWSFDFINDHAHAFFMDNRAYSDEDCYYVDYLKENDFGGEDYRSTADYTIEDLKLDVGKKFKFVFDFGYDWNFQCKVLRFENSDIDDAEIIREKGESPEQYPRYE